MTFLGMTILMCYRQKGCFEQDDLLRPYSSLDYAWDEPTLPHKLVLEQPGNRRLGEYDLDHVGSQYVVSVKATAQRPERRIQVCVRADGPQRVLQLIDMSVSATHFDFALLYDHGRRTLRAHKLHH